MHDYHEAVKMIKAAQKKAEENGWNKVTKIALAIGDDSTYSEEVIRLYFEEESEGTVCQGAEVAARHIKTEFYCPVCGKNFVKKPFFYQCPVCGTEGEITSIGREMDIEDIQGE